MKTLLSLLIFFCFSAFAQRPSQATVDGYLALVTQVTEEVLAGNADTSPVHCAFITEDKQSLHAHAQTQAEAQLRLQLICMKRGCAEIGAKLYQAAVDLRAMPESDLRDFLEFSGTPPAQMEEDLDKVLHQDLDPLKAITCESASPNQRRFVADACLTTPLRCTR